MRSPIQDMLEKYQCKNADDYRNALKEIVQEIALLGLSRAGFLKKAAFYGGTALRIFHGLERFSEDLDFSLIKPEVSFNTKDFMPAVRDELGSYGFTMEVEKKEKSNSTAIQSAFIKGGTLVHLIKIASIKPPVSGVDSNEQLKIKLEVDTQPPKGATFEIKYQLTPTTYAVRLYDLPSLFAGKIHAVLCRNWKNHVKGRDFYDYLWYLSKDIPLNLKHLQHRMLQTGHLKPSEKLSAITLKQRLNERFVAVDFAQVISDVRPFVRDAQGLKLWSSDFFSSVTQDKLKLAQLPR